jgi:hypothetical protein
MTLILCTFIYIKQDHKTEYFIRNTLQFSVDGYVYENKKLKAEVSSYEE